MSPKRRSRNTADLVFEIGVEELPAAYFDCVYERKAYAEELIRTYGLSFENLMLYVTPRRIVFHLVNLNERQEQKEEIIKGPSFEKCYDKAGNPTPALKGFLRSKGARAKDIIELKDDKRHSVAIKKSVGGRKTTQVLKEVLPELGGIFTFPRTMAWNDSKIRFPRPIRWLLCVYGEKEININFAGLRSSRASFGHRYTAPGAMHLTNTHWYFKRLRDKKVILDEDERVALIERALEREAARLKVDSARFDKELIHIVARLSECPFLVSGNFKKEYLALPVDVLSTCMKKHQKIFACYNKKGTLVNTFIAFLDGKRKNTADIRKGYENVLESRLRDAAFFLKEDSKAPFDSKTEKLKEVVFLGKLGTFYDKMLRLVALCEYVGAQARLYGNFTLRDKRLDSFLKEAARLCKVDLVTHMVYEFPELQGVAGREYLRREGYKAEVYNAVSEHYLPKSLSEEIRIEQNKEGWVSILLGIVDRIDTMVGALGSGIEVSGSEDPYALRRASGSVVKLIRYLSINVSLENLINKSYALYQDKLVVDNDTLLVKVRNILKERIVYEANEVPGSLERMILDAVLSSAVDDICDVFKRHEALRAMALHAEKKNIFLKACKVVERTHNIVKSYKKELTGDINTALFQDALEQKLYDAYTAKREEIVSCARRAFYEGATTMYAETFYDILHDFFDKVLVNVDDEQIQKNRLLLMQHVNELYTAGVADLALIQGLPAEVTE